MNIEDLRAEIDAILNPEPDPDLPLRDIPRPKLRDLYGLDVSYLETVGWDWEGSSIHPHGRIFHSAAEPRLHTVTLNSDVPISLFEAALRLFADSIVAYHGKSDRKGQLRYYPSIVLTFWSGFETFVRYSSELMLITVKAIPSPVAEFLQEVDSVLDRRGNIVTRNRYQPVLERYAVLLKYAYNHEVDRGATHWQRLESARHLRDYYTHLDVTDPRSISTAQVLDFMEAILLGIIWPSCGIRRTQLLGVYNLYWTWDSLRELADEFTEQPLFKDWTIGSRRYMFHCPFDGVDTSRFPNSDEDRRMRSH